MVMAALAAVASACGFAMSTSLQHQAASGAPSRSQGMLTLLGYLVRQRLWVLGISAGGVSFCLHALALNLGPIALVQPIMVSGIVFAVVIRAALEQTRPTRPELSAVSVTAVGLTLFLVMSDPTPGGIDPRRDWAVALVVAGMFSVAVVVAMSRAWDRRVRAASLGVAAGLTFGLTAGLVKLITVDLGSGGLGVGTLAGVLALALCGFTGVALNQQAYRLARLSTSMPVLNVVSVGLAVLFGALVFGEHPSSGLPAVAGQSLGLLLIGLGLWIIAARVGPGSAVDMSQTDRGRMGGQP